MKKLTPFLIAGLICISGTIRAEETVEPNKTEQTSNADGLFTSTADKNATTLSEPNTGGEVNPAQKDSTQLTKDGGDPVVIYVSSGVVLVLVIILLIILL